MPGHFCPLEAWYRDTITAYFILENPLKTDEWIAMVCYLVLLLRDHVVICANLAKELKAAAIKAGHDGVPATFGLPVSNTFVTFYGRIRMIRRTCELHTYSYVTKCCREGVPYPLPPPLLS